MSRQDEDATAEDDAKEDLELKDEDADQVRGGCQRSRHPASKDSGGIDIG